MNIQQSILAHDGGFGNVKDFDGNNHSSCPSAVVRPRDIGLAGIGMRSIPKANLVHVDGQAFAVGRGAWNYGETINGMDYSGLASQAMKALFLYNVSNLLSPGGYLYDVLVVGLPVDLLMDQRQAEHVMDRLKSWKEVSSFSCARGNYEFRFEKILVYAQPVGAYADWLIDDTLQLQRNYKESEVAVLDIGMNTLDLYVFKGGKATPKFIGGGKKGVRRLIELIDHNGCDIHELDDDLRKNRLHPTKEHKQQWLDEIFHEVEQYWPNLKQFTSVVPAGGGASILGEQLRMALINKGAHVDWPEDPVLANVKGLWKWVARELAH